MKRCNKCLQFKSLSLFTINRNAKDGRNGKCAACYKQYMDKYLLERKNGQKCRTCGRVRSLAKFYGSSNQCKECTKRYSAELYRCRHGEGVAKRRRRVRELMDLMQVYREDACFFDGVKHLALALKPQELFRLTDELTSALSANLQREFYDEYGAENVTRLQPPLPKK